MLNGKQFFQRKLEKLWSCDKARNVLIEKNRDEGSGKYILLDFPKYLSKFFISAKEQESC